MGAYLDARDKRIVKNHQPNPSGKPRNPDPQPAPVPKYNTRVINMTDEAIPKDSKTLREMFSRIDYVEELRDHVLFFSAFSVFAAIDIAREFPNSSWQLVGTGLALCLLIYLSNFILKEVGKLFIVDLASLSYFKRIYWGMLGVNAFAQMLATVCSFAKASNLTTPEGVLTASAVGGLVSLVVTIIILFFIVLPPMGALKKQEEGFTENYIKGK